MHRLTDTRLRKAKGILDKHNRLLTEVSGDHLDVSLLEAELLRCWRVDLQQLKGILVDMFDRHPDYKELAIRYMIHFPCREFHESFNQYRAEAGNLMPPKERCHNPGV